MATNMVKVADSPLLVTQPNSNLRFERKFVFTDTRHEDIVNRVHKNSFGFIEVFHRRKINNVYFDDSNYNFYKQNVEGVAHRKKLRLRWYGIDTTLIENPTIEIKKKIGEVGDKESYKLRDKKFNLNEHKVRDLQNFMIEHSEDYPALNYFLKGLQPTLLNTYERRYFLSFCKRFRITVDFNQYFYNPNYGSFKTSELPLPETVVELKYALEDDADAREVSQQIGTRLSKNSKYVNGLNLLYHPVFV